MTFMLVGATGMLGSAFAEALGDQAVLLDRDATDIQNLAGIQSAFAAHQPEVVVNCAGHVNAEVAEADPDPAFAANTILPGLLATCCRQSGAVLVHFSSTGCYGRWKSSPYKEDDLLRPTTVHHKSKVAGEKAVRESGAEHVILRTGWLFGGSAEHKKNFVWQRVLETAAAATVPADAHQTGNPTFVEDVVAQALLIVRTGARGTFNCVGKGAASRFEYVREIVSAFGLSCKLEPSGPFRRAAPVSPNESALNYKLGLMGLDIMPHWTVSLARYATEVRTWPDWQSLVKHEAGRP